MSILLSFFYQFLRAFLPWLSSGSTTQEVTRVQGIEGLDRESLEGVK